MGWLERDGGFLATLRANRPSFDPLRSPYTHFHALGSGGLAAFAAFGLVLEALIHEKHLFAGGKNKFGSAFGAFQNLVMVFHTQLRDRMQRERKEADDFVRTDEECRVSTA
ncbi:MAG TPA: hypothetical protein VG322_11100 [Candidatus Acidoferrales bacterium]|nr:hypothetical protein [Candidatus Acidoferrales bacterium]